ncbi:cysteine--tRNA ligase [Candidatus Parcubacteria bacterium]|nr:MAG: cysteine--tRNA ligase [Candidatus Parcubacteria bacterium]
MFLYNSKTRKIEEFKPLNGKTVKMYVCGITPYDTTHLGHAFTYVFYDTLKRFLEFKGYKVIYTQNVTDIDDDILRKAKETGKNWKELGEFWTNRFLEDMKALNVLPPTHFVKATNSIPTMIKIIEELIEKRIAYEKEDNIYFSINKFPYYGTLSKLTYKQMLLIAQERGGNPNDPLKKDPLDFLLWQGSDPSKSKRKGSDPQTPTWKGPLGISGKPGWHIECSAMICDYLGNQIDIHGGGRDLIFPHHESEIAQSESYASKTPFVKYWTHTSMLIYEGEKMAKSLGNLVMVKDLLKKYSANAIRYVLLSHHYRKPWEFQEDEITSAEEIVNKITEILKTQHETQEIDKTTFDEFVFYMENDLDTEEAMELIKRLTEKILNTKDKKLVSTLYKITSILGFDFKS